MSEAYPVTLENKFELAKEQYAAAMMQDVVVREIVDTRHRQDPSLINDFPNYVIEPTLYTNDDGTVTAGLNIVHSVTLREFGGAYQKSRVDIFDSLPLATLSQTSEAPMTVTPEFAYEMQRLGIDPTGPEPTGTLLAWQAGWQRLMKSMSGELDIDAESGSLVLSRLVAELPPYFRTHSMRQAGTSPYNFKRLQEQFDWVTNVRVPYDMDGYNLLRRTYVELQATRGPQNVYYALGAHDESSGGIGRVPGYMGLYSPKQLVDSVPFEYAVTASPYRRTQRTRHHH